MYVRTYVRTFAEDKEDQETVTYPMMFLAIGILSVLFMLPAQHMDTIKGRVHFGVFWSLDERFSEFPLCVPTGMAPSCPHLDPELKLWQPGHDEENCVNISRGQKLLLSSSATVHSIVITNGGKLVIKDNTAPIVLRTRHIRIENDGELHIGSENCPFRSSLTIILYGRADDGSQPDSYYGRKFIGVINGGTLEVHVAVNDEGSKNLDDLARKAMTKLGSKHFLHLDFRHPWSFITVKGKPLSSVEDHVEYQGRKSSALAKVFKLFQAENGEYFNVSSTSEWVQGEAFLLWIKFAMQFLAVTLEGTKLATEVLYKKGHDYRFFCRGPEQTEKGCHNYRVRFLCGQPERCLGRGELEKEHVRCSSALPTFIHFLSLVGFSARPKLTMKVDTNVNSTILRLADNVQSWKVGDKIVVASTDYSMYQAEEFEILPCRACKPNEVKVAGKANYLHTGEIIDGVDMRAEVGLLTRNILVKGEMERRFHMEGMELKHMGQQLLGHYPIHFHMAQDVDEKGGYQPPTYVKDMSIHHTFSRCVTVHGSNGLLIKDVVGYDSLGHCFFTEDGPEVRNTFDHCLGLVVKPGTLLPSDRDTRMCKTITEDAYPGYVPKPRQDCNAVSTFWLANPHNNLINCAAAGSEETGFWFVLHHVPTGLSVGMYPPGYSEHIPMGSFYNNRAHSNYRAGMIIDNGVKTTPASAKDKRPILTLISGRYSPHQDADPLKPREPALIHRFIAYKNQDHGAWLRGGDVWLDNCHEIPLDLESPQISRLLLVCSRSQGVQATLVCLFDTGNCPPIQQTMAMLTPSIPPGIQFYDGPINVQNCTFRKFAALEGRHTSALAFRLNNAWQSCPNNNVTNLIFEDVPISSRVFFGEPGPWFNGLDMDGDKTSVFHDVDGSVSEYPGSYLIKEDNWLIKHRDCIEVPDWRGSICSGRYAQVAGMVVDTQIGGLNDWIQVGFCYPKGTTFSILSDIHNRLLKKTYKTGVFYPALQMDKLEYRYPTKGYYYWDEDTGLLFLKLKAQHEKEPFAFCSNRGCERIRIKANIPKQTGTSDCEALAYPKYAEKPTVDVPMPKKLPSARMYKKDHFVELKIDSYKTKYYHLKDDFAYISVDGKSFYLSEEGIQVVVIDGYEGKVVDRMSFKNIILQGIPAQIINYVNNIRNNSIVVMTSKGRFVSKSPWTKVLETLGAKPGFKLKDKMAFVGYKGSFQPFWIKLETDEDAVRIFQALPVPVVKKMKL
ncbi:hypothetical protein L345_07499, partial [Ophiophagus hannah]